MTDRDRTVPVVIQKIDPVGNIVGYVHMIKDPVAAGLIGADGVAVTALILTVTMMRGKSRIGLSAAAPFDLCILECHCAAVG